MANQIVSDLFEQALETGKAVGQQLGQIAPGQMVKSAIGQVTNSNKNPENKNTVNSQKEQEEIIKNLYGAEKPVDREKIDQLKQKDEREKQAGLTKTKLELNNMKNRRYQEMQQQILQEGHKKEQEIPEYEAGAPGGARTWEEKQELMAKQKQIQAQKQNEAVSLPSSKKTGPGMKSVIASMQGSKELKLGKVG